MSEIVRPNFKPKKQDVVYSCTCGSQLFYLNGSFDSENVLLECRSCNLFVEDFDVVETVDDDN